MARLACGVHRVSIPFIAERLQQQPLLTDPSFIPSVHSLMKAEPAWRCSGLHAVAQLAWGLTLRIISQHPAAPADSQATCEEDEEVVERALASGAFGFLRSEVLIARNFTLEVSIFCFNVMAG